MIFSFLDSSNTEHLKGMPNLFRIGDNISDLLESFNAFYIDLREPDGKPLSLSKGSQINITMPVRSNLGKDDETYFWEYEDSTWN